MTRFQIADRVMAVVPDGASEVTIVAGFVAGIEQDGRLIAIRPVQQDEWEDGAMPQDGEDLLWSWWCDASSVYHVVDAEKAIEQCSRMNADDSQGGADDELGVDL